MTAYLVLVGLVAVERVIELVVSQRHLRWSMARGGIETGRGHTRGWCCCTPACSSVASSR